MAQKLSVQIALEGGKEVERQLQDIGEAGQKAFQQISQSAQEAGGFRNLKIGEVKAQLQELGVTGKESINQITQAVRTAGRFEGLSASVQQVEQGFDRAGNAAQRATAAFGLTRKELTALRTAARQVDLGAIGGQFVAMGRIGAAFGPLGIAITAVGAALAAIGTAAIGFADKNNKASDAAVKLGLSLDELKGKQAEFAKIGVSADAATEGIGHFQKEMQKLIDQADPGSNLRLFGNAVQMSKEQMGPFIERLKSMPDGIERTNLAFSQLGDKMGTQVIQNLRATEGKMGDVERKAYETGQAVEALNRTWQNLQVPTGVLDSITRALQGVQAQAERGIFGTGLDLAISPLVTILRMLGLVAPAAQQAGQAGQQAGQQAAQGFQVWNEELGRAVPAAQAAADPSIWTQLATAVDTTTQQIGTFITTIGTVSWDAISSGATTAWQAVTTAIQSAGTALADFATKIGTITWDAISSAGVAAWNAITGAINSAISAVSDFINKMLQAIGLQSKSGGGGGGGGATGKASGGLIGGVGSGTSDSNLAWLSRGEYVTPASVVRQPGVLSFLEAMRRRSGIPRFAEGGGFIRGFQDISSGAGSDAVSNKIANWIVQIAQANNTAVRAMLDLIDSITRIHENLSNELFRVTQDMNQVTRELVNRGMAGGGLLGGRGTGTSDSNLAWVSRGEHIMPAAAVRQPGVLAFLEALRRSGGNLSAVLDGMGRFALGGLVPAGGSMSHVTISFPGVPPVAGLRASAAVVDELRKAAALAQVRSGGRKPSRYS